MTEEQKQEVWLDVAKSPASNITKEEYFAVMALQGMLSSGVYDYPNGYGTETRDQLLVRRAMVLSHELIAQITRIQ